MAKKTEKPIEQDAVARADAMRFAEDYLDYSEAYLEESGLIDWE